MKFTVEYLNNNLRPLIDGWQWGVDNGRVYVFRDNDPNVMDRCFWIVGGICRAQQKGKDHDWNWTLTPMPGDNREIPTELARALIAFIDAKAEIERHEDW